MSKVLKYDKYIKSIKPQNLMLEHQFQIKHHWKEVSHDKGIALLKFKINSNRF